MDIVDAVMRITRQFPREPWDLLKTINLNNSPTDPRYSAWLISQYPKNPPPEGVQCG